jgi:hypothetical protein
MGVLCQILEALEANIVTVTALPWFADQMQTNGAAEFEQNVGIEHAVLQLQDRRFGRFLTRFGHHLHFRIHLFLLVQRLVWHWGSASAEVG